MIDEKQLKEIDELITVHNKELNVLTQKRDGIILHQKMAEMNEKFANTFYKKDWESAMTTKVFLEEFGELKNKKINVMYNHYIAAVDDTRMKGFSFYINGDMNDTIFSAGKFYVDELEKEGFIKISKKDFEEAIQGKMKEFYCALDITIKI